MLRAPGTCRSDQVEASVAPTASRRHGSLTNCATEQRHGRRQGQVPFVASVCDRRNPQASALRLLRFRNTVPHQCTWERSSGLSPTGGPRISRSRIASRIFPGDRNARFNMLRRADLLDVAGRSTIGVATGLTNGTASGRTRGGSGITTGIGGGGSGGGVDVTTGSISGCGIPSCSRTRRRISCGMSTDGSSGSGAFSCNTSPGESSADASFATRR